MEDLSRLTGEIYKTYEKYETTASHNFEQMEKSFREKFELTMKGLSSDLTPKQNKKKMKKLSTICDDEDRGREETKALRPVRTARVNALQSLKEPSIRKKMRRPVVKLERISNEILKENDINVTNQTAKPINLDNHTQEKLIISQTVEKVSKTVNMNETQTVQSELVAPVVEPNDEDIGNVFSKTKHDSEEVPNKKVKLDESVVIIPAASIKVEILSDGESEKMPPPAIPEPRAKRTRKKKDSAAAGVVQRTASLRITRSRIKIEPTEEKDAQDLTEETAIKKKPNKKSERQSSKDQVDADAPICEVPEVNPVADKTSNEAAGQKKVSVCRSIANSTIESVYEDANNDVNHISLQPVIVLDRCAVEKYLDKVKVAKEEEPNLDATFISPQPQVPSNSATANETFVMSSNSDVNSVENENTKCDETFFVASSVVTNAVNETIIISSNIEAPKKISINNVTYGSIMTEDASDEEVIEEATPPPLKLKLTKSKPTTLNAESTTFIKPKIELFSPFMQSPIKKKIEAFEQVAADSVQRQTRTKTKTKVATASQNSSSIPRQTKTSGTPNIESKFIKPCTPLQSQDEKIMSGSALNKKQFGISNSTSKLAHIQKSLQIHQQKSNTVTPLMSRENSMEDLRNGLALQSLEEKRKKREDKQRLAQQLREAKEKERREQTEKLIREREEKYKKILHEKEERARLEILKKKALKDQVEQRRQLEEINKNLRLQQQQKEAMLKLENEKRLEKELSEREYIEAIKREHAAKEMMRLNQEKDLLKLTLLKNKEIAARERMVKKSKVIKYDFDILDSDDSTDEEGKQTSKKPPPPAWSRSNVRQIAIEHQSFIPSKLIDSLFSIAPMSVDLREIFPMIDPKCLRRKSSAVWRTPPRYTLLPKY